MRVTILSTNDRVGGAARCALRIKESLDSLQVDTVLLSLRRSFRRPGLECVANQLPQNVIRAHQQEQNRLRAFYNAHTTDACVSMVSAQSPGLDIRRLDAVQWADVLNLHWTSWFLDPEAIAALHTMGKPILWTLHDEVAFTGGCHYAAQCDGFQDQCRDCPQVTEALRETIARTFAWKRTRLAGLPMAVVATSQWLADRARSSAIFRDRPIAVLPSGLNTDIFKPAGTKADAKTAMGFHPEDRILLMPAACLDDVRKGAGSIKPFLHAVRARAEAAAPEMVDRLKVVFFGATDQDMSALPLPAGALGDTPEETVLARAYAMADCFVTLSGHDNLPNTVLEAMSCGTPVAAFSIGGIVDMVRHGVQGYLAPWGDIAGLAAYVVEILAHPERVAAFGAKARADAVQRYALPVAGKRYVELIARLREDWPFPVKEMRPTPPSPAIAAGPAPPDETAPGLVLAGVQKAFALRDAKRCHEALRLVDDLLRATPGNKELLHVRGGLLVALGRPDLAVRWLADVYADDPDEAILLSLCDATRLAGAYEDALALLNDLARKNPLARGIRKKRGQVLEAKGDLEAACTLYAAEYRLHADPHALALGKSLSARLGRTDAFPALGKAPGRRQDAMPSTYCLETVLGCNLACVECAVGAGLVKRKHGLLSFADYRRIADQIRPHCSMLLLHVWGEPLLNKDIPAMVQHASAYTQTNLSTNAHFLDKALSETLLRAGLSQMIVSIDGTTQDVYQTYRRQGSLKKALAGLEALANARARLGSAVEIIPQFVVFKHNQEQKDHFSRLCADLDLVPVFKSPYLRCDSVLQNGSDPAYVRQRGQSPEERRQVMARSCKNCEDIATILLDGTVCSCCYDHNAELQFGNAFTQDFRDIWNSKKYISFREAVHTGNAPAFCLKNCLNF